MSFLKRGFKKLGSRWVCPLEIRSIYKSLAFTKEKTISEDYHRVVHNAQLEFSLHGAEIFNVEVTRLHAACVSENIPFTPMDHSYALGLMLTGGLEVYTG
jgi:hypothetical protein